jgi:hypothetical protein
VTEGIEGLLSSIRERRTVGSGFVKPRPYLLTMSADSPLTVFCVHTCLACPVNQAGMFAGSKLLTRGKKRSKYAKNFRTRRLFNQLGFFGEDTVFLDATTFLCCL